METSIGHGLIGSINIDLPPLLEEDPDPENYVIRHPLPVTVYEDMQSVEFWDLFRSVAARAGGKWHLPDVGSVGENRGVWEPILAKSRRASKDPRSALRPQVAETSPGRWGRGRSLENTHL
ncbi:hypothetical protein NHQ30_001331 [Ciborinia camelliae]|nr:hypothetical protein NHQ30_001331 [Ciborinia camelliae]